MSALAVPACAAIVTTARDTHELNATCDCWPIDSAAVREALATTVSASFTAAHKHLFAATGVFLHPDDLASMQAQVEAIEAVVQLPDYLTALAATGDEEKPAVNLVQQATRGVLMGYDFHVTPAGPRLIEINTNAGGAFLVNEMHGAFASPLQQPVLSVVGKRVDARLADMFLDEWRLAGRAGTPHTIAIVDHAPAEQYLYGDMLAAVELLRQRFPQVVVVAPEDLRWSGVLLSADGLAGRGIDLVYNRHTDFALDGLPVGNLRTAWDADRVVVTPSPRHHAVIANKQNLQTLGNAGQLRRFGAAPERVRTLAAIVPCERVTAANADALWARRRKLFFKPVAGFGGRAVYHGAKLTKKVWRHISSGDYVAQEFVPPPVRRLPGTAGQVLKYDLRLYTYAGATLGVVARLYGGQTTNFRTPGGGFAPVALLSE